MREDVSIIRYALKHAQATTADLVAGDDENLDEIHAETTAALCSLARIETALLRRGDTQ
jgi:hypothetical protein